MAKDSQKFNQEEKERLWKIHCGIVKGRWIWIVIFSMVGPSVMLIKRFLTPEVFVKQRMMENYIAVAFLIIYNLSFWFYLRKKDKCTWQGLNILRYLQVGCDLILAVFFYYVLGGIESPSFLIYLLPFLVGTMLFGIRDVLIIAVCIIVLSFSVDFGQYFGILKHYSHYAIPIGIFGNLSLTLYFLVTYSFSLFGAAIFAGFLANVLTQREKTLGEKTRQMEEIKASLEVKVRARKQELEKLSASLEEKVKSRMNELQNKMVELENFNKIAVDRELEMIELKKEIKALEEEIKKYRT